MMTWTLRVKTESEREEEGEKEAGEKRGGREGRRERGWNLSLYFLIYVSIDDTELKKIRLDLDTLTERAEEYFSKVEELANAGDYKYVN